VAVRVLPDAFTEAQHVARVVVGARALIRREIEGIRIDLGAPERAVVVALGGVRARVGVFGGASGEDREG